MSMMMTLRTPLAATLLAGLLSAPTAVNAGNATETGFSISITSVSKDSTLKIPGGSSVRAPIAPGVYLIDSSSTIAVVGKKASAELEFLAEDGNYEPLEKALAAKFGGRSGMFAPGQSFTITARPGDRFSFATMFVQSNDKFYAPTNGGIALFRSDGSPVSGDVTASVRLFDAGTEVDEQPGVGPHQAPRQTGPNQGTEQQGVVGEANDGFTYPDVGEVVRVEITPIAGLTGQ
jgi:hypothetical protein